MTKPYNDMEHFALITSHDGALNDQRFKKILYYYDTCKCHLAFKRSE